MKLKNITEIIFLPLLLVSGIVTGFAGVIPQWIIDSNLSSLLLALLVFQVGLGLSSRSDFSEIVRTISIKTLLLLTATALAFLILKDLNLKDCLAVGSGFGYYSLSSMLIMKFKSVSDIEAATMLATTALLANIIREAAALICCPIISKSGRGISAISLAGINSMDVCLPAILNDHSRNNLMPLAITHGIILEISVPLLLYLFC